MWLKIVGFLNGQYFIYRRSFRLMGDVHLPCSLANYAKAKRIAIRYGYYWPVEEGLL